MNDYLVRYKYLKGVIISLTLPAAMSFVMFLILGPWVLAFGIPMIFIFIPSGLLGSITLEYLSNEEKIKKFRK